MTKAYSYIRFSSKDQIRGDSLRRQSAGAEKFAKDHGLELFADYKDLGVSAFRSSHANEGGLAEFISALGQGKIEKGSYLIVESLDRLSRDRISIALTQFMDILECGIYIATLADGKVYKPSATDNYMEIIMSLTIMSRAHEESKTKGGRVGAAWANKRAKVRNEGEVYTRRCPSWLRVVDDKYALVEDKAAVVRRVFQMALSGIGSDSIAKAFNSEGVDVFGNGQFWHKSYIEKLLHNPSVYGVMQPCKMQWDDGKARMVRVNEGLPIEEYFPAVIDAGLFHRVKAIRSAKRPQGRSGVTFSNLFKGLIKCGECGSPVHYLNKGKPPKGRQYLQCSTSKARAGCNGKLLRYDAVENALLGLFTQLNYLELVPDTDTIENQRNVFEQEIAGLKAEQLELGSGIQNLTDAVAENGSSNALIGALSKKEQRQLDVIKELEELYSELLKLKDITSEAKDANTAVVRILFEMFCFERLIGKENDLRLLREKLNSFYKKYIKRIDLFDMRLKVFFNNSEKSEEVKFLVDRIENKRVYVAFSGKQLLGISIDLLREISDAFIEEREIENSVYEQMEDLLKRDALFELSDLFNGVF